MRSTIHGTAPILFASLLAAAARGDVLVVAADGIGVDHATIQAAIDAAREGDLVLVREGEYAGFTIEGVAVSVMADVGAAVEIEGSVHARNVAGGTELVLSGLSGKADLLMPGLLLADCSSPIRVERCSFEGGIGEEYCFPDPGGPGGKLMNCASASFVRCTLLGGPAGARACPEFATAETAARASKPSTRRSRCTSRRYAAGTAASPTPTTTRSAAAAATAAS